jgi:hypothetical protein
MSRQPAAAVNAAPRVITDYGTDPNGAGLFAALTAAIGGQLRGARPVTESSPTWYGYARAPQQFAGLAGLGSGMGRAVIARNSELSKETTQLTDPSLRILADRMARGQR